jgi:type 1 glutamine amidotransferase
MENIVSISDDDPNNQLAFVQQLVSQLAVAGNPVTINVVQTQQNVQGDIFYNGNSNNDNNNNDNSNNIVTKEYFDEEVDILSEALSDLDEKAVNLSEALDDVKAGQIQLLKLVDGITASITAGMNALVAG